VADRIALRLVVSDKLAKAVDAHSNYIAEQVLASSLKQGNMDGCTHITNEKIEEQEVTIGFAVAA
jgi:hypothetical protein